MKRATGRGPNINITQDEFAVSDRHDGVITTILGSCVATCIWDPIVKVGGMNHILVARSHTALGINDFAGINAMELLINALVRMGADRGRLNAKVFGGAAMINGLSDIGHANASFVLEFLEREGIPLIGKSIGGGSARQIRFFPSDGRAMQRTVAAPPDLEVKRKPVQEERNGVELF
ncbi:chemotaxis protein CheD [Pseudooceanicola sp. CBS1P-1]|uniref:Probable chemoreceptor glutamine deamidase CheD n=1 Tax=Pseudooceanicola albus TaxID=2692189 RepID=A0A6L7G260_9RHOB|nr:MULTISPECIES: chemotaxis protein CheD [Pseudooceanicola]MBT9383683.1 chemotaxis protein CheD [Pseudooceanicola endophyticus]MXN17537.1 chemotaxis protein CheD [Pseudooceanicola albus]